MIVAAIIPGILNIYDNILSLNIITFRNYHIIIFRGSPVGFVVSNPTLANYPYGRT